MEPQYRGAYLIDGDEALLPVLIAKLARDGVVREGSPDLYARAYRKFGVDEAHDITSRARTRPVDGAHRVFALFVPSGTIEAQNALLKTIEEPAADALFFIITPSPQMMLPTIRSRVQTMSVTSLGSAVGSVDAEAFLSATAPKRLEMLKPLYEHDEDEGRDIGAVIGFLQSLERRLAMVAPSPDKQEALRALYRARGYATDKGSLLKALLEQMALLMPKM